MSLTAEYVRSILDYDKDTGALTWKERADVPPRHNVRWAGKHAGSIFGNGYRYVGIRGVSYKTSRIIWLHVTGEWPSKHLDHINGDKLDERFCNLREATHSQNLANRKAQSNSWHGIKGVTFRADRNRWRASICVSSRRIYLGEYRTADEARDAYAKACAQHFGEFGRW